MVSPAPDETCPEEMLSEVEPFVEQFYPRKMSWYSPERPQGRVEDLARWIRENPWTAVTLASMAGLIAAQLSGPALRTAGKMLHTACAAGQESQ